MVYNTMEVMVRVYCCLGSSFECSPAEISSLDLDPALGLLHLENHDSMLSLLDIMVGNFADPP